MTDPATLGARASALVKAADVAAKAGLLLLLIVAVTFPESGNMQDKAAELRAVGYPLASFAIPLLWWMHWKRSVAFPWLPDLLVTVTCFSDILGNRLDLYDTVESFDDWMHFTNTGLLAAALILLTLPPSSTLSEKVERALALGATAAIAWEVAEYFAFIAGSTERNFAYTDTLGDLTLGTLGAVAAALVIHRRSKRSFTPFAHDPSVESYALMLARGTDPSA